MDMIYKTYPFTVKEIADRTLEFIGSTEDIDRDGEVVEVAGWKLDNYMKNPVFMWAHDYKEPPIGKALKVWKRDGQLKFNIEFAPKETYEFADTIYKLYKGGFLNATSVGFIPDPDSIVEGDGVKTPRRRYTKQELLELSGVPIPSQVNALRNAIESGVITTKEFEVITKPEETENFIRIPVDTGNHEGHRIRTIEISAKEGISAIYCGTDKVIMTYLFAKDHGWTMEKARAWVKEHEKSIIVAEDIEVESKSAIPYRKTPLDETGEWDAGKEVRNAEVDDLKIMCAIVEGDSENKTSYKLPHHRAGGEHSCVWRAVANCAAVLMGARGGVDAPAASIAGAKTHIAKHYADFDKGEPPWNKGASQAEILDELDYLIRLIDTEGMNDDVKKDAWNLVHEILRLTGGDIPETIVAEVIKLANLKIMPIEEPKPKEETFTNTDILESIKRISNNGG